jgi:hypothetical protein
VAAGVGSDDAGVNREALAADQALGHAAPDHALEQFAQQITVAEAAVALAAPDVSAGSVCEPDEDSFWPVVFIRAENSASLR